MGGITSLLKGTFNFIRWRLQSVFREVLRAIKNRFYTYTDKSRITSPDTVYSEEYYAKRKSDEWHADAEQIAVTLDELFEPDSVIDFGCAIGQHLEYFHDQDMTIYGVEGSEKALEHAVVPREHLEQFDLRDPYSSAQEYDLALCIEVAEHLAEPYSETLVDTVTDAAPVVFFTAATPGQSGRHHVNEQPRSYWIEKFNQRGYEYDEATVRTIRDELSLEVTTEIPENVFVFKQSNSDTDQCQN
ncbi:class I SAM-dependent methyltransferase [Halosimplex halophilum]|uniref:class I SAM-dependent methyltransferase n=1 Tax=Halosimplex halophilum TaxID=2559572 RepID=UPI0014355CBE|nr:methyltransferase domain-containing protein [Halosimplex halophilum]